MKAKRLYNYEPDYAVSPSETLREVIDSMPMTHAEFATRLDVTPVSLSRILKGDQPITYQTAERLEMVTGVPARFWNELEANYRAQMTKLEAQERLQDDLDWLKQIPTGELVRRGAIPNEREPVTLLRNTLTFYGVSSVSAWHKLWENPKVAARRSACFDSLPGPTSAWLRLGELEAHERSCEPFSKPAVRTLVKEARALTLRPIQDAVHALIDRYAQCGVAVVLVREMKKVPWSGATKWLTPEKVMVLLNLRGKSEDKFWFSFFHEAGHVLHDGKGDVLINDGSHDDPREARADEFAAETLIPRKHDGAIRALRSKADVRALAKKLGVSPGIVAGRYQHLTQKWAWFKDLIRRFDWAES